MQVNMPEGKNKPTEFQIFPVYSSCMWPYVVIEENSIFPLTRCVRCHYRVKLMYVILL